MSTIMSFHVKKYLRTWFLLFLSIVILLPTLAIFYWMVTMAFKTTAENTTYPPTLVPRTFTFEHQKTVFQKQDILRHALNSVIISGGTTFIGLLAGVPGAYAIVRLKLQSNLGMGIIAIRMLPGLLTIIGWYRLFHRVGLLNTYAAIILTHLVYAIPLIIWVMVGYFEEQDPDLEQAAFIDGCGQFRSFVLIALPLAIPGMTVSAILIFVLSWNDFLRCLIFAGPDKRPLTMAVFRAMSFESINWGEMMMAALIVILPILFITIVLQRFIIAGMTRGAIK